MTTTIQGLPATRAASRESTILHRVRRYEEGLRAVLASRPLELHHEPLTDAEHLIAVQYVAACEVYEAGQRTPSKPVTPGTAAPAPEAAPAPRAARRRAARRRARRAASQGANQGSTAPAAKKGRPPKERPAA